MLYFIDVMMCQVKGYVIELESCNFSAAQENIRC